MKIEITHNVTNDNYLAKVWDGSDGIDYAEFLCSSLGECFEEIIKWQMINAFSYVGTPDKLAQDPPPHCPSIHPIITK